ncbi:MAG: hypothetical protein Ct9H300mP8_00020 [Gammaproteobacteria bacterium]|nr:MAG: hypothetical protein Ct9H300mP8_00020 [Gammaproteobacteria bacterium]
MTGCALTTTKSRVDLKTMRRARREGAPARTISLSTSLKTKITWLPPSAMSASHSYRRRFDTATPKHYGGRTGPLVLIQNRWRRDL